MSEDDKVLPELAKFGLVLTPQEVADVLNLNVQVVQRLLRAGQLPGFRAGTSWRMRRSSLQEVMLGTWSPEQHG